MRDFLSPNFPGQTCSRNIPSCCKKPSPFDRPSPSQIWGLEPACGAVRIRAVVGSVGNCRFIPRLSHLYGELCLRQDPQSILNSFPFYPCWGLQELTSTPGSTLSMDTFSFLNCRDQVSSYLFSPLSRGFWGFSTFSGAPLSDAMLFLSRISDPWCPPLKVLPPSLVSGLPFSDGVPQMFWFF